MNSFFEITSRDKLDYLSEMQKCDFYKLLEVGVSNKDEKQEAYDKLQEYVNTMLRAYGKREVTYKPTKNMKSYGREHGTGVQTVDRNVRGFLFSETTDFDMALSYMTVLSYICKQKNIKCPEIEYLSVNG